MELFQNIINANGQEVAECIHFYQPDKSQVHKKDDLPMSPGNKIIVLKKDKGEWYGRNGRQEGWFPANRVKQIK